MKKRYRIIGGFIISAVSLWVVFRNFKFSDLVASIESSSGFWFIPALLIYPLGFALRTARWKKILSPMVSVKYWSLFPVLTFGFLVNNVLPARAGEFARGFACSRLTGIGTSSSLGSIAFERLSDVFGILFIFLLSLQSASKLNMNVSKHFLILILALIGVGALMYFSPFLRSSKGKSHPQWINKLLKVLKDFIRGFNVIKSPKMGVYVVIVSILVWMIELTTAALLSRAFGLNLTLGHSAVLIIGISLGVMIPAAPGYVGTYELFAQQSLVLLGYGATESLSFVLVLHFFQILISSLLGIPYLIWGAKKTEVLNSIKTT